MVDKEILKYYKTHIQGNDYKINVGNGVYTAGKVIGNEYEVSRITTDGVSVRKFKYSIVKVVNYIKSKEWEIITYRPSPIKLSKYLIQ